MMPFSENLCNISPDVNTYFFSKNLIIHDLCAAQMMQSLASLFGLIYLENNGYPIIGFLPIEYAIPNQQKYSIFKRNHSGEYDYSFDIDHVKNWMNIHSNIHINNSPHFKGGYMGFVDYNFAANQFVNSAQKPQPNFFIGQYNSFITFENERWTFHSSEVDAEKIYHNINALLVPPFSPLPFRLTRCCESRWNQSEYQQAFNRVQNYILAGDCYQINLTQEFTTQAQGSLASVCAPFWQLTQAPYAGFLKIDDFEILSCSPELFIAFNSNREVVTKPIKGTMPRFEDVTLDENSKQNLINSEKDRAENVMIVDLLRNDLSVYAETGSVKTTQLFDIESFNQVHHMVSEVRATLKEHIHPMDMLLKALPGGSITGAPKIRAMQIIDELEVSARGAYCGSMGYFNYDGTGSWNILIRTIQKNKDQVSIWAGGGITIASDCDAEYQECFDKVSALLNLMNQYYEPKKSES